MAAMAETRAGAAAVTEPGCCGSPPLLTAGMEGSHEASIGQGDAAPPVGGTAGVHLWEPLHSRMAAPWPWSTCGASQMMVPLKWWHLGHESLMGPLTPQDGRAVAVGHF